MAINLDIISQIESNNNPKAINKVSGAKGMYQFMPIAWKDVQQSYPELSKYSYDYALDPKVSRKFAEKLFELNTKRLGKKATDENLLASYNYGIGAVLKGKKLPKETVDYINKYKNILAQNAVEKEVLKQALPTK